MSQRKGSSRSASVERQLDALYDELPHIECRGKCWDSCGPIDMSHAERRRLERVHGRRLGYGQGLNLCFTCDALTPMGRCSVYDVRPMICRLWGLMESMACPYGCRPEGGHLSDEEGFSLLARAMEIGGQPEHLEGLTEARMRSALDDPTMRRALIGGLQKPRKQHD